MRNPSTGDKFGVDSSEDYYNDTNFGDDDPERYGDSLSYDYGHDDDVEEGDSDERKKLLKDRDRRAKEYERLRSEHKELQEDIKKHDEKIREYGKKILEAQAKNDEAHLESLRIGVDNLKQTLKERKDRLNEVAKKLDYFEGKNSKSNDRWGVDPQPQLQIDDSTPAEHIVNISEPKNSLDDVDLSKHKGRRNRRNKGSRREPTTLEDVTQQPSIEELEENIKYLEGGIDSFSVSLESLRERKNTDYGSTFEGGIYKLLEEGDIDNALNRYYTLREDTDMGDSVSVLQNISKIYGISLNGLLAPEDFEERIREQHEMGFVPDFSYIFDKYNDVDDEIQKYEKGIEKLKKEVEEKKKLLEELKQATKLKEESDELDEEIDTQLEKLLNEKNRLNKKFKEYHDKGDIDNAHKVLTEEIYPLDQKIKELKQAQKLKEESEKVDKEIENVAEEHSNDPVYNKKGEFEGNTATTILSDGTEGDIGDLTWDDVEYDPIKREYYNKHTGQVVKGRPPQEEDANEEPNPKHIAFKEYLSKGLSSIGAGQGDDTNFMISEDNDDWLLRRDGSGLLIVLNKLKQNFENLNDVIPGGEEFLKDWDASEDISADSKNVDVLFTLFEGGINDLISMVYKALPRMENNQQRVDWDKVRELKENGDPLYDTFTDLHYVLGISNSIRNNDGTAFQYIADDYFSKYGNRLPLNAQQFKYAYNRAPKPETDTFKLDAVLSEIAKAGDVHISDIQKGLVAFGFPYEQLSKDPDFITRLKKGQLFGEPNFEGSSNNDTSLPKDSTEILLKLLNTLEDGNVLYEMLKDELQKEVDALVSKDIRKKEDIPYKEISPENHYDDVVDNIRLALKYDDIETALLGYKNLDSYVGASMVGQPNSPKELLREIMEKYGIEDYKTDGAFGTGFLKKIGDIEVNTIDDAIKAMESQYGGIYINNKADVNEASAIGDLIRALINEYEGRDGSFELGEGVIDWSLYLPQLETILDKLMSGFSEEELDSSLPILKEQLREEKQDLTATPSIKRSNCCEEIINKLGEIDKVLRDIKNTVNKTNEIFSNEMWRRIVGGYGAGGSTNNNNNSDSNNKNSRNPNKKYRNYRWRVDELNNLLDSTDNEEIKAFAEDALGVAKNMHRRGIWKYEKNFDVVHALLGGRDISKLSQEEIGEIYSKRGDLDERIKNTITQSQLDKQLSEKDDSINALKSSSDLDKKEKIAKLEKEKEELLKKEIIGDDEYQYLQLKLQAYNKLKEILSEDFKLEAYEGQLSKLISAVSGVKGFKGKENGLRVGIRQMEEMLNLLGIDTSEAIENSVAQVGKTIRYYENKLKKTNDVDERIELEGKIKNLKDLRKEFKGKGEPDARSGYGHSNPNIPHPSEESLDEETWQIQYDSNPEQLKLKEEIKRLKELKKTVKSETTKSLIEEQLKDKQAKYTKSLIEGQINDKQARVLPSDVYDHIEHEKSESHADIFDTRWDFLRGQFAKNKERLEYFQGLSSDLLGEDWVQEEYEKTLKKLEKIKTAIHTLRGEDGYDYDKHEDAINRIGGEFEKVAISIDEAIKKAKEFEREVSEGAENVEERNRVALGHLFGEDFEWNKDGTAKVPKTTTSTEKAPLEGRLTRMAYNFRQASQSANQFSGVLTKLFSIVGTGNALNDMITASSLRQTNQIMLASSRGMEEAKKLYDRIQMLVVKLPGNDTFLTNILTMLGTMDKSLSAQDLEYMGGVIADYYMGAQAKGQFNNETERELRNYLMTGQTRNLTNSIIASEIESLKGLNSVKERTVALEKALQATGMDSIAHYDSYTNSLEEFKGRFQKAFADLGDLYLGFLQGGMKVYNFIDSLTNSALSQFVITIAVSVMGLLAFFGIMAELLSMSAGLIEAFDVMNKLITDTDKQYSGLAQTFRKVITWIAFKTGVINADTASQVINTDATIASTISQELNTLGIMGNVVAKLTSAVTNIRLSITAYISMWSRLAELDATTLETIAELGNTKVKIIARLVTYRQIIANTLNTISTLILAGALRSTTKEYMRYVKAKIESALIDTLIIALEWGATIATMAWYGATLLLSGALTIVSALLSPVGLLILGIVGAVWLLVKAFEGVGQIFGWWTNIGEMFQAIGDGIHRVWDAFMNSEPVQYIIATFQNLTYTLGTLFNWITSIGGNIWQTIFGVDDGSKSQVFDIVGVFLEVIGAIGKIAFTPLKIILDIINAIGSAIAWFLDTWNQFVDSAEFQGIIKDFQEIRAVIGEAWNTLSEAFNEVRDAFMSVFEDDEDMKNTVETTNILLDVLRAVATFLRVTIIPIIKFIAYVIKGIADVIKFVVDIGVGVIDFFTGGSLTQDSSNLVNQSQLAQNYTHQISNAQTIINNNFASGSVLTDARNMTAKEVMKLFTSAFGFNKARGVDGVIN